VRQALHPHALRGIYDRIAGRYDLQHAFVTAGADGRGRRMLVREAVRPGDRVLDAGGGTGSTGLLAAERAGGSGCVVVLDQSRGMLDTARRRGDARGASVGCVVADMEAPPFRAGAFDVILSTYSMCPLVAPSKTAAALYALLPPGGRLGVAHSTEPRGRLLRWVADKVESWAWRFPGLWMGCRAVSVLPSLVDLGAVVEVDRRIGVPLWPFQVFVVRKPESAAPPAPEQP